MRGNANKPPAYRKHKRSGQAIVTLNGQDFYLGPHDTQTSKAEYDRLIGEWLTNGRTLPSNQTNRFISITELCAAYWQFAKGYYVKNGKPTDELPGTKTALRILKGLYGTKPVHEFGPISLTAIQNAFVQQGHCRRYVNQNVGRIKRMFKWGVSRELVPIDVYQALTSVCGLRKGKTIARESDPVLPVDDAVVEAHINRACDKAFPAPEGIEGNELKAWQKKHRWAPNRLRHSTATEIRKAHGLEAGQVVAGHSNADVTQIYAERDIAKAAAVMAQVG